MATRFPLSTLPEERAAGISKKSENLFARIMPVCLNKASYILSVPAKAPVWDTAALIPASDLPTL